MKNSQKIEDINYDLLCVFLYPNNSPPLRYAL